MKSMMQKMLINVKTKLSFIFFNICFLSEKVFLRANILLVERKIVNLVPINQYTKYNERKKNCIVFAFIGTF